MQSVNYIINAHHYSQREGADGTVKGRIKKRVEKLNARGAQLKVNLDKIINRNPVTARILMGQWIADCECGGAEFVAADEPFFFCFSCLNRVDDYALRPVVFPTEWEAIEALLLERPVDDRRGLSDLERAYNAKALIHVEGKGPLVRSWDAGETLDDLIEQNKPVQVWKASLKEKKK